MKKTDEYNWAEDAIASYALSIQTLRERYPEECPPGEIVKDWIERRGDKGRPIRNAIPNPDEVADI